MRKKKELVRIGNNNEKRKVERKRNKDTYTDHSTCRIRLSYPYPLRCFNACSASGRL